MVDDSFQYISKQTFGFPDNLSDVRIGNSNLNNFSLKFIDEKIIERGSYLDLFEKISSSSSPWQEIDSKNDVTFFESIFCKVFDNFCLKSCNVTLPDIKLISKPRFSRANLRLKLSFIALERIVNGLS